MKKLLCVLLALVMLAAVFAGCAGGGKQSSESTTESSKASESAPESSAADSKYPDYLNLDSYYPLVKEGNDITIKVATLQSDGYGTGNPDDYWFIAWIQQKMNIKFDTTMIPESSWTERKPLMFAGGELPDLLLCMGLSTSDLVSYGETSKQLLDWTPYLNEDITPTLLAWFDYYPTFRASVSCANGGMYSLPSSTRTSDFGGSAARFNIRTKWLDESGTKAPETLDEFVNMLREFKKLYPDSIPLGGGYATTAPNTGLAVLNALGYVTNDALGVSPSIREGKVVIPVADEHYREFLATMKTLYDEELVSKDMFTMDIDQFKALALDDKFGAMGDVPYLYLPDTWDEWECLSPLTSDVNSVKQWYNADFFSTGQFAINANTAYPELLCRLGDWYFTDDGCVYGWGGPQTGSEETLGMVGGWFIDEEKIFKQQDVVDGKYPNNWEYYLNTCYPNGGFCAIGNTSSFSLENQETAYNIKWERAGYPNYARPLPLDTGDGWFRISQLEKLSDYVVEGYPTKVFLPDEINTRLSDLQTIIKTYATTETAKFITGQRPLDDFDKYIEELKGIGVEEYLGYYADYYESYKENLG